MQSVTVYVHYSNTNCLAILFIRQGKILGSRSIFPSKTKYDSYEEILSYSLMQFYLEHDIPREIILNKSLKEKKIIVTIPASGPQEEEVGEGVVPRLQPNGRSKAYLEAPKWGPKRRLLRPRGHD